MDLYARRSAAGAAALAAVGGGAAYAKRGRRRDPRGARRGGVERGVRVALLQRQDHAFRFELCYTSRRDHVLLLFLNGEVILKRKTLLTRARLGVL